MTIHKEGLEFLGYMGLILLLLGAVAFHFSGGTAQFFATLLERRIDGCLPVPVPRGKKKTERRIREEHWRKASFACKFFGAVVGAYFVLDFFFFPDAYRLPGQWRFPALATVLAAGVLVIFVGSVAWDERIGWEKWTFWMSAAISCLVIFEVTHVLRIVRPDLLLIPWFAGTIVFLWFFGVLRRIDRRAEKYANHTL